MASVLTAGRSFADGIQTFAGNDAQSNAKLTSLDETISSNQTNELFNFTFTNANLKAIGIMATQDMTIKTNSSGAPQETIHLKANQPYTWSLGASYIGSSNVSPFLGDVSAIYVTNTTAGALTIRSLESA